MNVKSIEKNGNQATIVVEIDKELMETGVNKAYMKARKSIMIPGFRKGKAPRKMIEKMYGAHDEKVFRRELIRLESSLKSAGDQNKMVFHHYPPRYRGYECREIIELLERYEVRRCFYGHLHSESHKLAIEGQWGGVEYRLVSADYIGFKPVTVIL